MNEKKNQNDSIKEYIWLGFLTLCLAVIVFIFVIDIIGRIKRGWNNNDTIQVVFLIFVLIIGLGCSEPMYYFLISRDKKIMVLNNDIYKQFKLLEKEERLDVLEEHYLNKQETECLSKMNKIIGKYNLDMEFTKENVSEFFYPGFWIFKGGISLPSSKIVGVEKQYRKIFSKKSVEYEKLYRSVQNSEIIKEPKFPLFSIVFPFFFGALSVFITIYQSLPDDGSFKESVFDYLKLLFPALLFGILMVARFASSSKEIIIKSKKETLAILKIVENH